MRIRSVIGSLILLVAVAPTMSETPLGTGFIYQGQLKQGGAPLDGTADFQFTLWDAAGSGNPPTGGIQVGGVQTINAQAVASGLFTVALNGGGAFGANAFNGNARWLQIAVRSPAGGGAFITLAPRQSITAAPFAAWALNAPHGHSLDAADGSPVDALYVNNSGFVGIGTSTPDNTLHVLKGSAGTITANGNSPLVVESSTDAYLSILTPDTTERGVLFGEPGNNAAGGMVYNSIGTPDGLQFRTNGNVTRMALDSAGRLGIGTTAPAAPLDMSLGDKRLQVRSDGGLVPGINLTGTGGNLGILRIRNAIEMWPDDGGTRPGKIALANAAGSAFTISLDGGNGSAGFTGSLSFGTTMRQMLNLWTNAYGIGIQAFTEYFRSDGGFAWFNGGVHNDATNNPGAGGSVLMVLGSTGNLGLGTTNPAAKLDVNGRARVNSLEIVGGADLAEAFEIRSAESEGNEATRQQGREVDPGTVVVIDSEHPGALRISSEPHDAKVAGIVSGAKGLAPGMVLRSEGSPLADGKHLVAMSGRVWCKCDASSGRIRAGDLLTTSATTGHAMRVADDKDVPRGCIIGKAMTSLTEGKGLVLVLVNLQ